MKENPVEDLVLLGVKMKERISPDERHSSSPESQRKDCLIT